MSDAEIARATGANRLTVGHWRRYHGLPVNDLAAKLGPQGYARRMLYYQLGWSDVELGKTEGLPPSKILRWRRDHGLPANFSRGNQQCYNPRPTMADVYRRIRRAVGAKIGRENVDDAVAEISLALLDGTITLDEIEQQARRYGNRVLEQFASKWGPRSLDQQLGEDDGFTLLDTIADERSSSWLEEMGATVW
ncbi:hypothetical protein M9978_08245 [Sphingomonas sp. MG17]|uniref:Uncharacterized protein n=1 Tax=Sphingomonas tagetis TaxID=2949092 RepID=A0A9X2HIT5_9SPHN|nr:hypothetical protein [Sphingomonas tagetis]MCP3730417.1 hypothetical protein [Sphingomonas tagetis]